MVLEDLAPGDKNATRIQKIQSAAMRANALTRQLLAFSQQRVVVPTAVNLNTQVAELAKMLPTLLRDEVECILDLDQSLWDVRADPTQIDQVIMNLSLNARDAMPEGGTLRIETRNVEISPADVVSDSRLKAGIYALLVVKDTGTGISPEAQEHIFEPFFTTKESGKGTGLGLATVYGIVQQSGGFIGVKTHPGRGTAFSIYLPKYVKPTFSENLQEVHA
jgi:signal transduction histidine kinase